MKYLILLAVFALASQLVTGKNPPSPEASVICKYNHTVSITISNVDDIKQWEADEWRLENDDACKPTLDKEGKTVNYDYLKLPDCAYESIQLDADNIQYVLKVRAKKDDPGGKGQLRAYDHLYYVFCEYDAYNRSTATFIPIVNRNDNVTGESFFKFFLRPFHYPNHTGEVLSPVALGIRIHFKAYVLTQSEYPNLDLFLKRCWSSTSASPMVNENDFNLIKNGCGNDTVSEDVGDTLNYTCTSDSIKEYFSLDTYRYFGQPVGSKVYIHCDMRVCLANVSNSACECPSMDECDPKNRRRRSLADQVNEDIVYRISSGPFIFESEEEEEEKEEEVNEEEGVSDEQDKPQSLSTNMAIIVVVSGVVALAICATIFFVVRSRNKRRQHGDLNVAT